MRYDNRWARLIALSLALSVTLPAARKGTFEDAVQESSGIVLGQVLSTNSYYGSDGEIYTDVVVEVGAKVRDRRSRVPSTLTFTVPGGQVGDLRVVFSETPAFAEQETVLLLVDDQGRPLDKYSLDGDFVPELGRSVGETLKTIVDQGEVSPDYQPGKAEQYLRGKRGIETIERDNTAACYKLMGPKWATPAATYKLAASIPQAWGTSLTNAVASWNGAGSAFRFSSDANSGNQVSLGTISGSSNILAQTRVAYFPTTNRIANFQLTFSSAFQWSTTGEAGKFDVQGIFAHEMGHALGLDHPAETACSAVTMWASARSGDTTMRTLEPGDKQGVIVLYGASTGATPTPPAPTPTPAPTPAPTAPTLNSLDPWPTAPLANTDFLMVGIGSGFQSTLQFVIRGGACPAAGCVVTGRWITPGSALGPTRLPAGAYTVGVRNGASGTLSATRNLTVR